MEKKWKWFVSYEDGKPYIARVVVKNNGTKSLERYPRKEYQHLIDKPHELKRFVLRLNNIDPKKIIAEKAIDMRSAFFNEDDLDAFRDELLFRYSSQKNAMDILNLLKKYGLSFMLWKGISSPAELKNIELELWS